jgi:ankyrin repeat protein
MIFLVSSLAFAENLHEAVKEGNMDMVKRLIDEGANINAKDQSSATPLYLAVDRGLKDLAIFLIQKGANVNIICTDKMTALHREALKI